MTEQQKIDFFNEHYPIFETELEKRRNKWHLKGIPSIDFDDVKQIILFHIFKKIHLYDISKAPLPNWTNAVISAQLSNLLRNNLYSISRPCLKCPCALPTDGCEIYDEQSNRCYFYKHWEDTKKSAHSIRLPLPMENRQAQVEIFNIPGEQINYEKAEQRLHIEMEKVLKPHEYRIYKLMIIMHLSDEEIAKQLNFKSTEKFRRPGYNTLSKMKKLFIERARKLKDEIDLF